MRRIRQTKRFGGWLALLALALQLTASFGHIHPEDFAPPSAPAAAASTANHPGNGSSPATGDNHDDCPICQSIYLLATSVMPLPPTPALPLEHALPRVAHFDADYLTAATRPRLFQARAPPQA